MSGNLSSAYHKLAAESIWIKEADEVLPSGNLLLVRQANNRHGQGHCKLC